MVPVQDNKWEFCMRDYAQSGSLQSTPSYVAGYPVTNVIDGDTRTFWKFSGSSAVLTIVLDRTLSFNRVFIRAPFGFPVGTIAIAYSSTISSAFEELAFSRFGSAGAVLCRITGGGVSGRRVRVTFSGIESGELRIHEVCVFKALAACDAYVGNLSGNMPANPQNVSGSRSGTVLVPLLHGNNVRLQSWGGLRRQLQVTFPMAKRMFLEMLQEFEERATAFGIVTHEYVFHNVIIQPGGLTWEEADSDGPGIMDDDELTEPTRSWYNVSLQLMEVAYRGPVTDEELVVSNVDVITTDGGVV